MNRQDVLEYVNKTLLYAAVFCGIFYACKCQCEETRVKENGWTYKSKTADEFSTFEEFLIYKRDQASRLSPSLNDIYCNDDLHRWYWFSAKKVAYQEMIEYVR